jgi:hypothetical protein
MCMINIEFIRVHTHTHIYNFDYAFENFPCHKFKSLDIKSPYEK